MSLFIMLTRLVSEEVKPSFTISKKEKLVVKKVREICPQVKWIADYAVMGPWDYVDIFEAPDMETAMKVSALVRQIGGTHTEVWPTMQWEQHERIIRDVAECVSQLVAA